LAPQHEQQLPEAQFASPFDPQCWSIPQLPPQGPPQSTSVSPPF
jgi:hypothetical protein